MSNFVTQSVESSVAILVFARPGPVVELLRSQLQAKHLEVLVVDPLHFSEEEAQLLQHQFFYKTCWVFDDSIKGTPQADLVFQFLYGRSEPILIVTSSLGSEDVSDAWVEKKWGDTQLLQHFKRNMPQAKVLVAVNWFDQPNLFVSPFSFFQDELTAIHSTKSGVSTEEVVAAVVMKLTRPHQIGQEDITKVRKFSESEVRPYLAHAADTESRQVEPLTIDDPQPVITEETLEFLQVQENTPSSPTAWYQGVNVYQELEDFEARHRDVDVQVFPLSSPKIPNRQRLYEENMNRIKQRSEKQRLLRPVPKKAHLPPITPPPQLHETELKPLEKHLEVTIQQLFGSQRQLQRAERLEKKVTKTVRVKRKQVRQKKLMVVLALLAALGVTAGVLVGSFVLMRASLFSIIVKSSSENLADQTVWQDWKTKKLVDALATEIQLYQYVGGAESLPETAAVVSAVRQMQTIHQQRVELQQLADQSVSQVLGKSPGNIFDTITALAAQQQTLYSSLSLIQTQLQSISTEFLADNEQQAVEKITSEIQQTRRQVATFEQVRQLLPAFLAQNERRRVAIMLLDSQELRPAGGVIEGVYLVTLEKGTVIDQQFFTSEQLEGDKTATLPAPADYKKYLSPATLPLTDAGWGPDFTDTATTVNGLLDHTLGRKADLIVGVTTNTLQEILAQTGPLALDGTKETLTEKNFFERIESHPEENYLSTVFVTIFERLFKEPVQATKALAVISNDLQAGQAFLVSAQPTENDVLNSLGWAGQISSPQCPSQLGSESCQISTIYQLESNVGLNKVGSLIQRKIQHTVQIGKDQIRHKRMVTLTNQAKTTRWPSGPYKDYIRFYLPEDTEFVMARVGDTILDPKTMTKTTEKGRTVYGFLVEVPIQSSVEVSFEYRQKFTYAPGVGFAFFDQKQAGTQPEDYELIISPQDGLQAGVVAPKAELRNGQIVFTQKREKHQFVGIKFR